MLNLLLATVVFVLLHKGISGSPLRGAIIQRTGESAFALMFQVASIAAVAWLCIAYAHAQSAFATRLFWPSAPLLKTLQLVVQPTALLFVLAGVTTRNPGTYKQEASLEHRDVVRGILRVTRHPFLWGVALYAVGHLVAARSARNLVLFGTLAVVALSGTRSIDRKRAKALGPKWTEFAASTSNLPFGAIIEGRQQLLAREIGWMRVAVTALLSLVLIVSHE